jgi:hypothetical protein
MQGAENGSGMLPQRVRRFAVIGAIVGAILYVAKVAADDWDFGGDWPWLLLIVLGAMVGLGLGVVAAGVGQSSADE